MGSGGQTSKPSSAPPQASSQRTQGTINKAARSIQTPGAVSKIGGNLQSAEQKVQEEANAYTQGAKQKSFNLGQDQLEKAASGEQGAMGAVGQRLNQQMADRAEAFQPKTQYQLQEVQDIQSNPGIKNMYRREVGPQYGRGESAFDAMLLQKNPEFQKQRAELVQKQQALSSDVGQKKTALSEQAQKDYDQNFARDTADIRNRLGGIGESELDAARKYAEEVNARRAGIDIGQIAGTEEQQLAQALQQELEPGGSSLYGRAGKLLSNKDLLDQINEQEYIRKGGNVGMEDVLNENQAAKFNRVMGLLGDTRAYQAGKGAGEDITRDTGGLKEALKQRAVQRRMEMDAQQQAKLADLQSQLGTKAYGLATGRNKEMESFKNNLAGMLYGAQQDWRSRNADQIPAGAFNPNDPQGTGAQEAYQNAINALNLQNYGAYGQNASWRDLVDQSNAGDINAIYQDLGMQDQVGAGAGVNTSFDKQRMFQDALNQAGLGYIGNVDYSKYVGSKFPTIQQALQPPPQTGPVTLSGSGPVYNGLGGWV